MSNPFRKLSRLNQKFNSALAEAKKVDPAIPAPPLAFMDALRAHMLHGASIAEYFMFQFWNKSHAERSQFMTSQRKRAFMREANDPDTWLDVNHKAKFDKRFERYLRRHWISLPEASREEFVAFVREYRPVFIKGCQGGWGEGIRKIDREDPEELTRLYDELIQDGGPHQQGFVVEEGIVQNEIMQSLHPQSVNTVRIVTFNNEKEVVIMSTVLRCGCGEAFVDNHAAGGVSALIDPETGIVNSLGAGQGRRNLEKHPDSGVPFMGFQIPCWEEAIRTAKEAAASLDNIHYMGWDLAFPKAGGVCIIEGNPSADIHSCQEIPQVGVKPLFDRMLKDLAENKRTIQNN